MTTLTAVYDFQRSPPTFDFITFLAVAESTRIKGGHENIMFIIAPGNKDGFRRDVYELHTLPSASWRRNNITYPAPWLLPSVLSVLLFQDREEMRDFLGNKKMVLMPRDWTIDHPTVAYTYDHISDIADRDLACLVAPPGAARAVMAWKKSNNITKPIITISLRESKIQPLRNSNLKAWLKFAGKMSDKYEVVFIRDLDTINDPLPYKCFNDAIWNIYLRAAIYEQAYMNYAVNNGPSALLCYLKCPCRIFKIITEEYLATTESYLRNMGLPPGSQMRHFKFNPDKQFIWKNDDYENIVEGI